VLNQFDLTDGGRILLGTSQWLTPKGEEVRGVGIAPDEVVDLPSDATPLTPREAAELSAQALRESSDVQLRRALELVDGLADRQP
jgi:carboxyl-terminal processing protease